MNRVVVRRRLARKLDCWSRRLYRRSEGDPFRVQVSIVRAAAAAETVETARDAAEEIVRHLDAAVARQVLMLMAQDFAWQQRPSEMGRVEMWAQQREFLLAVRDFQDG